VTYVGPRKWMSFVAVLFC